MTISVPLLCCKYRDVSLLMRVHMSQQATALCDYAFNGSKDALCIHTSELELSVNANMCDHCTSYCMVV